MKQREYRPAAATPRVFSRVLLQRVGALLVFVALVLGQSLLQNTHIETPDSVCIEGGHDLHGADHSHEAHEGGECPHKDDHEHDPEKCGICKQLLLAKTLVAGDQPQDFVVEFVEVADGRVIGLVHRAKPELANAPTRGPPAADL